LSESSQDNLGLLPKSDANAGLQRTSINALNAFLRGQDNIIFRDERIEDYGVDGSFELKKYGLITNLRAQVQLKSSKSVATNKDGSISLPVETKTLNYLLYGIKPLYKFFDAVKNEFW